MNPSTSIYLWHNMLPFSQSHFPVPASIRYLVLLPMSHCDPRQFIPSFNINQNGSKTFHKPPWTSPCILYHAIYCDKRISAIYNYVITTNHFHCHPWVIPSRNKKAEISRHPILQSIMRLQILSVSLLHLANKVAKLGNYLFVDIDDLRNVSLCDKETTAMQ